jgi:hypothetical protein
MERKISRKCPTPEFVMRYSLRLKLGMGQLMGKKGSYLVEVVNDDVIYWAQPEGIP